MANKILEPNMMEMQRRRSQKDSDDTKSFEKTGRCHLPLYLENQKIVLFSSSHVAMSPFCSDPENPGIKIYGIFPDMDSIYEYIDSNKLLNTVNIQTHPVHSWAVVVSSEDKLSNAEYIDMKVKKILEYEEAERTDLNEEFDANVKDKKCGDSSMKESRKVSESTTFDHKKMLRDLKKTHNLSSVQPIYGQKFLVASFVPDNVYDKVPEFLFKVYAAFDSEDEADAWVRHVLSEDCTDFNIDVVSSCQWLYPQSIKSSDFVKEKFRGEELNNVMQYHKNEPSKVKQFKDWNDSQPKLPEHDLHES